MALSFVFAFLVVMLLVALIGGGLISVFRSRLSSRWVPLMIASVLALSPFVLLVTPFQRTFILNAVNGRVVTEAMAFDTDSAPSTPTLPPAWIPAYEAWPGATANHYPSQPSAEAAAAETIINTYQRDRPLAVTLIPATKDSPTEPYHNLARALRLRGVDCAFQEPFHRSDTVTHALIVATFSPPKPGSLARTLTLRSEPNPSHSDQLTSLTSFNATYAFAERPWLTAPALFRNTAEQAPLLVGISRGFHNSKFSARESALLSLAYQLSVPESFAFELRLRSDHTPPPDTPHLKLTRLVAEIESSGHLTQWFDQRLDGDGPPRRRSAALLPDARALKTHLIEHGVMQAPDMWTSVWPGTQLAALDPPAQSTSQSIPQKSHSQKTPVHGHVADDHRAPPSSSWAAILFRLLGLGLLVGLTLLIYRVLDHWTRGYRQGPLVITAVVVILGGAALLGLLSVA